MPSLVIRLVLALALLCATVAGHVQADVRSRKVPLRGVNLGGWLVAENWMTQDASIWNHVPSHECEHGEYHAMKALGHKGQAAFDRHRSTFITQADVEAVAAAKFNTVRVPVGYWIQGCDHITNGTLKKQCEVYAKGGLAYLDVLVKEWALKHNVAVLLSLHGAPGSQNGKDHSGVVDGMQWGDDATVAATKTFAHFLVDRYAHEPAFLGLGLLNEPSADVDLKVLKHYYNDMYHELRAKTDCILVMMPQLQLQLTGQLEDLDKSMQNVWVEWHPYLIWGYEDYDEDNLLHKHGVDDLTKRIASWKGHPLLFGEWSFVTANGTFKKLDAFQPFMHKMLSTMNAAGAGWTYWTWKVAGDDTMYGGQNRWSMRQMLHRLPHATTNDTPSDQNAAALSFRSGANVTVATSMLATDENWVAFFGPPPVERWTYDTTTQQLRSSVSGLCLDASYGTTSAYAALDIKGYPCQRINYNQKWIFRNHQLVYRPNSKCLSASTTTSLTLVDCDASSPDQTLHIITDGSKNDSTNGSSSGSQDGSSSGSQDDETVRIFLNSTGARLVLYRNETVQFRARKYPYDGGVWLLRTVDGLLQHHASGLCLQSDDDTKRIALAACDDNDMSMQWAYDEKTLRLMHGDRAYCLDARRPMQPTIAKCSRATSQRFSLQQTDQ
ncbi:hypothetical protein SPRG_01357 [Saprolegnia parasitica CBS 223.65]|uniref:glucan 1,3-beta-glucosidase n=1 Tax=Saprolegnia parasitica (strain CBS 223.65) TaxID=695850 RepID=A0A067CU94_SAPPC|nr:hypothetical protein SPRG_01357 [Saprolegnia parasitica CBS 223.65]KDO34083.1 hypothetical protein SPRG_01357 [Saprolegnia parasitica CBS 223.65]|eukprot:XP_012194967.1 hypothetical protein SPRG_01357 [Saprolegnia parasitica CBS 223.65]